ncbi:MAG TPA: membrane protein insertion efficiency factor YidD [Candidatus Binataceae bacterium]|nr:membrane protein insertion efficiency factor YidD [Candidatus Binataceae bacterium]
MAEQARRRPAGERLILDRPAATGEPGAQSIATMARRAVHVSITLSIKLYQVAISPLLTALYGPACRYEPSCSEYAHDAIAAHGVGAGGWLAIKRLGRCRPGGGWGVDPVPTKLDGAKRRALETDRDAGAALANDAATGARPERV